MTAHDSTDRLGTAPLGRLLFEFSLPAVFAMVIYSLYNIIDTAVLGWYVGENGVAVGTLTLPVMNVLMAFSMLIGQGGNAYAAIQLGEGSTSHVERTLGNSSLLMLIVSGSVGILGCIFVDPVLAFIGTPAELWDQTRIFVQILCVFDGFLTLGFGLNNFLRTAGKPTMALLTTAFGVVMCIIFNLLFVAVMGMGVAGSALATVCGEGAAAIPVLWFFIKIDKAPFKLKLKCLVPHGKTIKKIIGLGLASFALEVGATIVNIVFNHVIGMYGSAHEVGVEGCLAAIGVSLKVVQLICSVFIGISMGMQPIVGFNYGARSWRRVLKVLRFGCLSGFVIGFISLILVHLFPNQIVMAFGIVGSLEQLAAWALFVNTIFFPLVGFQIVAGSYFQSSGQPVKAAVIELLRQVIFLTPLYVILPMMAGIFGQNPVTMILVAVPTSDILSVLVTSCLIFFEVRKLKKLLVEK